MTTKTTLGLIGAGAVGSALAPPLARGGIALRLWSRTRRRTRALAQRIGREVRRARVELAPSLGDLAAADCVLICVPDRSIAEVARDLAAGERRRGPKQVALHTSGFHDESVLAALERTGWSTGSLHPLISLPPSARRPPDLEGAWFAVSGQPAARRRAKELVSIFGGQELRLEPGSVAKRRYHAAATMLAGGLVALFDAAEETVAGSVSSRNAARRALADLAASVLANLAERGPIEALTGPAVRSDWETVAGHLQQLGPETGEIYRTLTRRMLRLARARGVIGPGEVAALDGLL